MPASESVIMWYLAYTQSKPGKELKASSLSVYLSAIKSLHVMNGLSDPPTNTARVKLIVKAIMEDNGPSRQKLPVTFPMVNFMIGLLYDSYDDIMFKAAITLGFFGGLRGSEYTVVMHNGSFMTPPLRLKHITFGKHDDTHYITVTVPRSKTNPNGFVKNIGCSEQRACAVCLLSYYIQNRTRIQYLTSESYVFALQNGDPLTKELLDKKVKVLVTHMGLDSNMFSSHSLRAGAATSGAIAGLNEIQIKAIGQWSSRAYLNYIRQVQTQQIQLSKILAKKC